MPRYPLRALATLSAFAAACGSAASPTDAMSGSGGGGLPASRIEADGGAMPAPRTMDLSGEELRVQHQNLTFLVSGDLLGDDPAGMGIYMDRPSNVGTLPMAVTYRQDGRNLWGTGMDQDTSDPYPDYVSVFQSTSGDVFRFREGGRAILGNGIGRPEAEHVLTIQDKNEPDIENILNLSRGDGAHSSRYIRAFNNGAVEFAVGLGGRVGVGKDYSGDVALDVASDVRARSYLQVEEPDQATNVQEVLNVLDDVARLVPLEYTPTVGDATPRYGLLDTDIQDKLFPETVKRSGTDNVRSVDYAQVTTLLVAAVKELTQRVEAWRAAGRVGGAQPVPPAGAPPPRAGSTTVR